jgi:hypothetical protein
MKILIHRYIGAASHSTRNRRASSGRDITDRLIRCRSSNVWAYGYDNKDNKNVGTAYVQFKNATGGPGDIYRYYDVPLFVWKKFLAGPSKGHNVWKYLRNSFKYSKITGDKRGKLKNAVN